MRISLLLQREPFSQIVEKTLSRFCQVQYGQPYRVRWYKGHPDLKTMRQRGEQLWLGNIYLNAIFTPDADSAVFDPIQREFTHSAVRWRRPLQRAYVSLATSQWGAPWLAQVGLGVVPAIPDAQHKLIVAGNHKVRILDHKAGLAYGILKDGFGADFIQRELEARRMAEQWGLPVPRLKRVAADGTWFSECYVSGTPINRLTDPKTAGDAVISAANALIRLLTHTLEEEALDDHVARLHSRIQALITGSHLLSELQKQELVDSTDALVKQIGGLRSAVGDRILTALTHGDFQPANILVNRDGVWLIDWEYSTRRQAGHDALVFMLGSRLTRNLAARLQRFVTQGPDDGASLGVPAWPGTHWGDAHGRRLHGALFLLEELELHLEENANPRFVRLGAGLAILQQEISRWIMAAGGKL